MDASIATPAVHCARCGVAMTCTPQHIEACPCSTVVLTTATRERIAARYKGCLCNTCLLEETRLTAN